MDNNVLREDEELSLYDIIDFLLKYKKLIITTLIIVLLVATAGGIILDKAEDKGENIQEVRKVKIDDKEFQVTDEMIEEWKKRLVKAQLRLEKALENYKKVADVENKKYPNLRENLPIWMEQTHPDFRREINEANIEIVQYSKLINPPKILPYEMLTVKKSKTKVFILVGLILGLLFGIGLAMIKEFIEGYKNRKN